VTAPPRPGFDPPAGLRASAATAVPRLERREHQDAWGRCIAGDLTLPPGSRHGARQLDGVLAVTGREAVLLGADAALLDFRADEAIFFDTETTGLLSHPGEARGQRPMAFLIGTARFQVTGELRLRQWLWSDPRDEGTALQAFVDECAPARVLVSFNGRSFDRHLLADRLTTYGLPGEALRTMPHLDLVHPARRLGRPVLPSCALGELERAWLGVFREGDLPGSEVPDAWDAWRRTGQWPWIEPVLDHNTLDILSLVTLLGHLAEVLRSPGQFLSEPALLAAGKMLLDRGDEERGREVLGSLCEPASALEHPVRYGAARLLAEHCRRQDPERALRLLRTMQDAAGIDDPWPWELALRILERDLDAPARALEVLSRFLPLLDASPDRWPGERAREHRRLARLTRSGGRSGSPAPPAKR
jgi:uncharacterized protein YprB with RNaseH-like and TPR domain